MRSHARAGALCMMEVRAPTDVRVRPLEGADEQAVRALFRATLVLGHPLPFEMADLERYEALCLDWYLGPGRDDAAVAEAGGETVGFVLVCVDQAAYQRWVRRRAARYAARTVLNLARMAPAKPVARFHRARLRDGLVMARAPAPMPAHCHINLAPSHRTGWTGRLLAAHVDERCRAAGLPGWFGEMNARAGSRARALERLGGTVVHRAPNHTLSWLSGVPVERLTVVRMLPELVGDAEGAVAERASRE